MSAPASDAVTALRAYVELYIERARNADREHCTAWADHHHALADLARTRDDVDAEGLHVGLSVLYRAHGLAAMAAAMIAEHHHDPLAGDRDPRGGA